MDVERQSVITEIERVSLGLPDRAAVMRRAHSTTELVDLFSGIIWRFASAQLRRKEDAEDVVMEVFASAFSDFPKLIKASDQRSWLLGVARRKIIDVWRKQYQRSESDLSSAELARDETKISVTQLALEELYEDQRCALILKYVIGLGTDEVAAAMGRSTAAANSLLQRARESLKKAMSDDCGGVNERD